MTTLKEKILNVDACINGHGLNCKQRMTQLKSWLVQKEFFNHDGTCRFCVNLSHLQEARSLDRPFVVKKDLWNRCFCTSNCIHDVNLIWDNLKQFMCAKIGFDPDARFETSLNDTQRQVNEIRIDSRPQGLFCMATQANYTEICEKECEAGPSNYSLEYSDSSEEESEDERPPDHIDDLLEEHGKYKSMSDKLKEKYEKYSQKEQALRDQLKVVLGVCKEEPTSEYDDESEIEWSIPSPKQPIVDAEIDLRSPPQSPAYEDSDSERLVIDTSPEASPRRESVPSISIKKEPQTVQEPTIEFPQSPPPTYNDACMSGTTSQVICVIENQAPGMIENNVQITSEKLNPKYEKKYENFLHLLADTASRLCKLPTTPPNHPKPNKVKNSRRRRSMELDPSYHPSQPYYRTMDYPWTFRRSLRVARINPLDW